MKNVFLILAIVILAKNLVISEVIEHLQCTSEHIDPVIDVTEIRVSPCPEPGDGRKVPCSMPRGSVGNISVDFIPKKEFSRLDASLAFKSMLGDLHFPGMESDVCKSLVGPTGCPFVPGTKYTWAIEVKLSRFYQSGIYPLKLKFTDGHSRSKQVLCELFAIKLT